MMNKILIFPLIILLSLSPHFCMAFEENRGIKRPFEAIDALTLPVATAQPALAAAVPVSVTSRMYWLYDVPVELRTIILDMIMDVNEDDESDNAVGQAIKNLRACAAAHKQTLGYLFLPPTAQNREKIISFFNWALDVLERRFNADVVMLIRELGPNAAIAFYERIKFPGTPEISGNHLWKMAHIISGGDDEEYPGCKPVAEQLKQWIQKYHPEFLNDPSINLYIVALFSDFERGVYKMPTCTVLSHLGNEVAVNAILAMLELKPVSYFERMLLIELRIAFDEIAIILMNPLRHGVMDATECTTETLYLLTRPVLVKKLLERAPADYFETFFVEAIEQGDHPSSIFWHLAFSYGYVPTSKIVRTVMKQCSLDAIFLVARRLGLQWKDEQGNTFFHLFIEQFKDELISFVRVADYDQDEYEHCKGILWILYLLKVKSSRNTVGQLVFDLIPAGYRVLVVAKCKGWVLEHIDESKQLQPIAITQALQSLINQSKGYKFFGINKLPSDVQFQIVFCRYFLHHYTATDKMNIFGFLLVQDLLNPRAAFKEVQSLWDAYQQLYRQKKDGMSEEELSIFYQLLLQQCFKPAENK